MGVADDEASLGARHGAEPGLQRGSVGDADGEGFLHRNSDLRVSVGNIQGPARVTAYEVYFR
jgi:hypothetical protein